VCHVCVMCVFVKYRVLSHLECRALLAECRALLAECRSRMVQYRARLRGGKLFCCSSLPGRGCYCNLLNAGLLSVKCRVGGVICRVVTTRIHLWNVYS